MIRWPEQIIDSVARRRCVLIIGSGVSASSVAADGSRPPTWKQFLEAGLVQLNPQPKFVKSAIQDGNYLEACQYIKTSLGENWITLLRNCFLIPKYIPSDLHKAIFDLDVRTTVSLNFDSIYDKYANGLTEGTYIVKKYDDKDIRQTVAGPDRYLIKMHGSMDTPSKMIFTAKDYAQARIEHREFYEVVQSLLHTHTCLMIGCGLSDPDVRLLFEDYRHSLNESPHFQTMPKPLSSQVADFIRDTRGINVIPYEPRDGHRELVDSVATLASLANEKRERIASSRDW